MTDRLAIGQVDRSDLPTGKEDSITSVAVRHLEITQEEIGALSGMSRQNANQCLKRLEKEGLLRLEYGGVTIVDLERLRHYGE